MKRIGVFFAVMFVLSAAVYAQSYTITVTFNEYGTWENGVLEFSPLGIRTQCWFDGSTPLRRGNTYSGAITYMSKKEDSVTGGPRPGIFLNIPGRQIFIHEGTSKAWSQGCIVIPRDVMLKIWNYIDDNGDRDRYVINVDIR